MNKEILRKEYIFKSSKSSGSGGQHVNKVNSRIQLFHNLLGSNGLSEGEKTLLQKSLSSKINGEGFIVVEDQSSRSQLKNKKKTIGKIERMYSKVLSDKKSKSKKRFHIQNKQERLDNKKRQSEKKKLRKPPSL